MNQICISGKIKFEDCKIRILDSGLQIASFKIESSKRVKGEWVNQLFDCSIFGNRAEPASMMLRKDTWATVTGSLEAIHMHEGKAYLKVTVNDFAVPPRSDGTAKEARQSEPDELDQIPF